jgi:CHAD domain-containing protein
VSFFLLGSKHPQGEVLSALEEAYCLEWGESTSGRLTFLDTQDWRLFRQGLSLRMVRADGHATLTLRDRKGASWSLRASGTPAFASELPQGPLREVLLPITEIRRLLPRARVRWEAKQAAVLNEDFKTVVRIRIREWAAAAPTSRTWHVLPPRLELLSLKGYQRKSKALESFLWRSSGLRRSPKREVTLAMEVLGEVPGRDPSAPKIKLNPEMTGAVAARAIHRALLSVILNNEDGLTRDLDTEFLHDFRVGIRRTRAALGQIKGVFPPEALRHFSREFRWLGGRTGPTRDIDVYLLKIPGYQDALPEGVKDQLEPLVRLLEHKKLVAHRGLIRSLETKRYRKLLEDWEAFLESPAEGEEGPPNAGRPVLHVAKERIWKIYRRVLADGLTAGRAGEDAPAELLHDLRIKGKHLRYLIGFFQSLFPEGKLLPLRRELKRLQDNLGDFNDLHVQQLALRSFADEMLKTRGGPPETLMAMGRLMGQLETEQEVERRAFHRRFAEFATARNVKRFRKLFKPGSGSKERNEPIQETR